MKNKKWKKFGDLSGKCYSNMAGLEPDGSCWLQAYALLKEIILEEREKNPEYAPELELLDDMTDYVYDIQGWLEDCMDELDMEEKHEELLKMCEELLEMFEWKDYSGSDLKFMKSSTLESLGRKKEAAQYCKEWLEAEPGNIMAATAGVYAYIGIKEFDAAEKLVCRFITDESECSEENEVMFTAASKLYQATGNKKAKKRMDKALEDYDRFLEEYFEGLDDEDEMEFWDEDLLF